MAKKTAPKPKNSLSDLIDQHLALAEQIEKLEKRKKDLADDIAALMRAENRKTAYGHGDKGYRLDGWLQSDYDPKGVEYIKKINKAHLFVPEPLITNARLRNAFQNGHLTEKQHNKIKSFAGPDYPVFRLCTIQKKATHV